MRARERQEPPHVRHHTHPHATALEGPALGPSPLTRGRQPACTRRSEMDSSQSKLMMLDPMPMLSNHAIHATSLQDAPTGPTEA